MSKSCVFLLLILLHTAAQAKELRTVDVFSSIDTGFLRENLSHQSSRDKYADVLNLDAVGSLDTSKPIEVDALSTLLKPAPGASRRTVLHQNSKELDGLFEAAEKDKDFTPVLAFDLFNDVNIKAVVNAVTKLPDGSTTVSGTVQGMPGSFVSLTKEGDNLFGSIKTYDKLYTLSPTKIRSLPQRLALRLH